MILGYLSKLEANIGKEMDEKRVIAEHIDGVVHLQLNRPNKRNALDGPQTFQQHSHCADLYRSTLLSDLFSAAT